MKWLDDKQTIWGSINKIARASEEAWNARGKADRQAVEEAVSVEKLAKFLFEMRQTELYGNEGNKWEDVPKDHITSKEYIERATAIRKQILTELFGGKA